MLGTLLNAGAILLGGVLGCATKLNVPTYSCRGQVSIADANDDLLVRDRTNSPPVMS